MKSVRFLPWICLFFLVTPISAQSFKLTLRFQQETEKGSGRYHQLTKSAAWDARSTAVIVCDVWDLHHSQNAVKRVVEFAPRLNQLLKVARQRGATIIHSPSDCMAAYKSHPARKRAIAAPRAKNLPEEIRSWCSVIPREEAAVYPLDQSDGGDDDDPREHALWVAKLKKMGRNTGTPWKMQTDLIAIDKDRDYISDKGDEVWNILKSRNIKQVILTGVHTNMCVLGRPFGLRQMARNGKQVVLVRDMTDTMYNPARWPYVSHFTGTDLIVSHIEKFVCPTITSDQILGGKEFRFRGDKRPHLVILMAEREYETKTTLPKFAVEHLGRQFRVTLVHGDVKERNSIPGIEAVENADVLLVSVRRRALAASQLAIVRKHVASGKPVVGIRTASHAFSLRGKPAPAGHAVWEEFDPQVFGGHYTTHYGNKLKSKVTVVPAVSSHPILKGITKAVFPQAGSLYKTAPLVKGAQVLLTGKVSGHPAEPVAWTFRRQDGGKSFYTSLGHPGDFRNSQFVSLLVNGIRWAAGLETGFVAPRSDRRYRQHWSLTNVPRRPSGLGKYRGALWYRCSVRLRKKWSADGSLFVKMPKQRGLRVWFNGTPLKRTEAGFEIKRDQVEWSDANLLVVRVGPAKKQSGLSAAPRIASGDKAYSLAGRWQFRVGNRKSWSNIPLPARYGTSTDILFEPR